MMAIAPVLAGFSHKWRWYHLDGTGNALAESIELFDSIAAARRHYMLRFKTSLL